MSGVKGNSNHKYMKLELTLKKVGKGERAKRTVNITGLLKPETRYNVYNASGKKLAVTGQRKDGLWATECDECDSGPFVCKDAAEAVLKHFDNNNEKVTVRYA